jgi:hypothetical protein
VSTANCPTSLRLLLDGLVDYAGLFPPAGLSMAAAVAQFAGHQRDPRAWMLGRFIVPTARLHELETALGRAGSTLPATPGAPISESAPAPLSTLNSQLTTSPWRLSALSGPDPAAELTALQAFNQRHAGRITVDMLEFKPASPGSLAALAHEVPENLTVYCELPPGADLAHWLDAIAAAGLRAKLRTGGVTPEAFPAPEALAAFLAGCARRSLPFKATAGLHHPVRGPFRLTYEPGSPHATMHGFINLFFAAAFAQHGWTAEQLAPLLAEKEATAFQFNDSAAVWRGHALTPEQLGAARTRLAIAFGSCSFDEPVTDLVALGWLP